MVDKYVQKYRYLRRHTLCIVQENAALADQNAILKRKVSSLREECRIIYRQLQAIEGDYALNSFFPKSNSNEKAVLMQSPKGPGRKRGPKPKLSSSVVVSDQSVSGSNSERKIIRKTIRKTYKKRKVEENIQLQHDICGQVVFPITLKNFEIHSLGEIAYDKPTYHTEDLIYPVGFCSTHVYGSVRNPRMKCIYTCKISDGGYFPRFEISSDGEDGACFVGSTPNECHSQLIETINSKYNTAFLNGDLNRGADFFGLSHPRIHDLILSLPGVSNCSRYSAKSFEERNKVLEKDNELKQLVDATIFYDALIKVLPATDEENSDWLYQ